MEKEPPTSEQLPTVSAYPLPDQDIVGRRQLLLKIFALVFLAVAALGLVYTFAQPANYQSQATVLVASQGGADAVSGDVLAQQLARQPRALFSSEMIAKTRAGLADMGYGAVSAGDIKRQLSVRAVVDTSLLEIVATGSDGDLLPRMVNTWLDVYSEAQAAEAESMPAGEEQEPPDELARLELTIENARSDLETLRTSGGTASPGGDETQIKARVKELQRSLKTAEKQEEKTRAVYEEVQHDIAQGDVVAPREQLREMGGMEAKLNKMVAQLADLDKRYTREFLALQPKLAALPEQIESLDAEIKRLKAEGNQRTLDDTRRDYEIARNSVAEIRQQIAEQERRSKEISAAAEQISAGTRDLENLELQYRETKARLAQSGNLPVGELPQLRIIDRATVPDNTAAGDISRNAMIALCAALAAGLLAAWLYSFLNPVQALDPTMLFANSGTGSPDEPQLALEQDTADEPITSDQDSPPPPVDQQKGQD